MAADRTGPPATVGRSPVEAPHAMVATSQPLAAQAGLRVLQEGGNAVDAAVAAAAVLCVTEPMSTGLGGDCFVLGYDASSGRLYGLNGSGRAPSQASVALWRSRGHDRMPHRGVDSITVPGAVDAWGSLLARYGTRPLGQLLGPAIAYAREGFPVAAVTAHAWAHLEGVIREDPVAGPAYLPGGRAPRRGERVRLPELARTLERLAVEGPRLFYEGAIGRAIAEEVQGRGGLLTAEDLAAHRSEWVQPLTLPFRGVTVAELPPNGQGIVALEMLGLLDGLELEALGFGPAEDRVERGLGVDALHHLIEVTRLAFADREAYLADPASGAPAAELLAPAYLARRRAEIDPQRAGRPGPGTPSGRDTVYLTVVDEARNAVSFIQSLYDGFGSGVGVAGTGIVLQNRGACFTLEAGHPNALVGGRRPKHTIIPAMALVEGRPYLSFGVMGGDMQPQGHVQVLLHHLVGGLDVQAAGEVPRLRYLPEDGSVTLEHGVPGHVRQALAERGHVLVERPGGYGGYQAIRIDPETGDLTGASDPRKDGQAVGY